MPLVFENKVYDTNGVAYFDLFNLDGIIGDKYMVNGNVQPFSRSTAGATASAC